MVILLEHRTYDEGYRIVKCSSDQQVGVEQKTKLGAGRLQQYRAKARRRGQRTNSFNRTPTVRRGIK